MKFPVIDLLQIPCIQAKEPQWRKYTRTRNRKKDKPTSATTRVRNKDDEIGSNHMAPEKKCMKKQNGRDQQTTTQQNIEQK